MGEELAQERRYSASELGEFFQAAVISTPTRIANQVGLFLDEDMSSSNKRTATKAMQTHIRDYFRQIVRSHIRPAELITTGSGKTYADTQIYLNSSERGELEELLTLNPDEVGQQHIERVNTLVSSHHLTSAQKKNEGWDDEYHPAKHTDIGNIIANYQGTAKDLWERVTEGALEYHSNNPNPDRLMPWKLFLEYNKICKSLER